MVAAGILIGERDEASLPRIQAVMRRHRLDGGVVERFAVRSLCDWSSPGVIPILLDCLDWVDPRLPQSQGPWRHPALRARDALFARTGFTFPLDAAASRRAWESAAGEPDREARNARLEALLGDWRHPLSMKVWVHGRKVAVRLRNEATRTLYLAEEPGDAQIEHRGQFMAYCNFPAPSTGRLAPGAVLWLRFAAPDGIGPLPADCHWTLSFGDPRGPHGHRAWVGSLESGPPKPAESDSP
jgi:hypothetical protein